MFEIIDPLVGKEIRIIGKRQEKYIGKVCEGGNCDFIYYDEELTREVICIECEGKKYEIKLENSYGECGSGWCTASWGNYHIEEVQDFGKMTHRCLATHPIRIERDEENDMVAYEYYDGKVNEIFSVSYDGIDPYYPSGGYRVNSKMFEDIEHATEESEQELVDNKKPRKQLSKEQIKKATRQLEVFIKATKTEEDNVQIRDTLVMKDGEQMSVQASRLHYCSPRVDGLDKYEEYEIGFPSQLFDEIRDFAETPNTTDTVFGWVPEKAIAKIIARHGGIDFIKSLGREKCEQNPEVRPYIENRPSNIALHSVKRQIGTLEEPVEVSLCAMRKLQQLAKDVGEEIDA